MIRGFFGNKEKIGAGKFQIDKKGKICLAKSFSSNVFWLCIYLGMLQIWLIPNDEEWNA